MIYGMGQWPAGVGAPTRGQYGQAPSGAAPSPPMPQHGVRREARSYMDHEQYMSPQQAMSTMPSFDTPARTYGVYGGGYQAAQFSSPVPQPNFHFNMTGRQAGSYVQGPGGQAEQQYTPGGHSLGGGYRNDMYLPPTPAGIRREGAAALEATAAAQETTSAPSSSPLEAARAAAAAAASETSDATARALRRTEVMAKAAGIVMPEINEMSSDEEADGEGGDADPTLMAIAKMFKKALRDTSKSNAEMMTNMMKMMSTSVVGAEQTGKCILTTKEIESHIILASPETTRAWVTPFAAMMAAKVGTKMERLFSLPMQESSVHIIEGDDELFEADRILKMAIYPCISKSEGDKHAKALLRRLKDDPLALKYGFVMFLRVQACQFLVDPSELSNAVDQFKQKQYFTSDMNAAAIIDAGAQLKDDLAVLPLRFEPDAGHVWLLKKMPESMYDVRHSLERELMIGQAQGLLPWTFDVLVRGRNLETAATERGRRGDTRLNERPQIKCSNCGKAGHGWRDCKQDACDECGNGFCPRSRSKANECFLKSDRPGDTTKDAIGRKLCEASPGLLTRMRGEWDRAKAKRDRSARRERETAAADEESEDEYEDEGDTQAAEAVEGALISATQL
jgi:hypothetical protein